MSVLYNFDAYLLLTFYHQLIKLNKSKKMALLAYWFSAFAVKCYL